MTCKEADQIIIDFFDNNLELKELKSFVYHMENCEDCLEELTIQYLVHEGMQRLEDGEILDLNKDLNNKIEMAKRKIKKYEMLEIVGKVLQIVLIISLILFFVTVML